MAVVLDKADVDTFIKLSNEENLEATPVAVVTDENRLEMTWRGDKIVDLSRDFLNTNGATKNTDIEVVLPDTENSFFKQEVVTDVKAKWLETLSDLNVCSLMGLCEKFDSTIGADSVLMPFGGKYQLTPSDGMAA